MAYQADFCILGAGIAGLSLADALAARDFDVILIEKDSPGAGASGTPGGLVNPATGRRAKKSWKAEACYRSIADNLERIQQYSDDTFYRHNGLLRPALLEKMSRKMKEQHEQTIWPEGWCEWKTEAEIQEIHPGIQCVDGGLWLPIGLTVDIGKYTAAYADFLTNKLGVKMLSGEEPTYIRNEEQWHVELPDVTVSCPNLVYATGPAAATSPYWDWLPFELIKGQVATFRLPGQPLSFEHSISSLGYMARTGEPHSFVQGSTYEHDFEEVKPDGEGEAYLRKRMQRTLPELEKQVEVVDQWAGVRTSTPNYKPILGRHPVHENLHLFAGLGSKGLLYGKFLADHYADHLVNGTKLYPKIDIARYV